MDKEYTSPQIQNHLLQLMGNAVRQRIIKAVQEATVFAILANETKDVNKIEQLSIAVRYVDIDNASVYECFLTYVPTENQTAEGISGYILDTLERNNLNPKTIVAQGYDGAAVMSGSSSGVQTRIKAVAPYAMYIHCNAHCLNLCLVDCVKVVYSASEFFSIVQNLYTFISTSKCHVIFMQQQTALYPGKQHRQLQRLSDTRWACRQSAINAICYRFDAIIGTLVEVVNGNDGAKAAEANGILLQVKSFKFILCLVIFDRVLSCSKGLSDVLQSTHLDLGKAADLVTSTIQTLEQFRTDDEWEKVLTYSRSVADVHGVSTCESSTRPSRNPRPPRRIESHIITGTTGCRVESTLDGYKVDLYFSVLDAFLSELKRRFSDKNRDIMRSLQACCPSSDSFFVIDHLKPMIHMYDLDLDMISSEIKVARRTLTGKKLEDISGVIIELAPLKVAFPTLLQLLRIVLTIPVSSAKCERTFSTLKRIKTYIRSSMSEDRLNDTAILAIEHDITSSLNLDNIVTEFSKVNRRIAL